MLIHGSMCVCVLTNIFFSFPTMCVCSAGVFRRCLCVSAVECKSVSRPCRTPFKSHRRSALPLPECSAARQTGKEYGQCVVVGDWLCYWPTIYSLTSCFPLCLSPPSLQERFVCLSLRIVVYVNMSAPPAPASASITSSVCCSGLSHVTSSLSSRLQLCVSNPSSSAEAYS